MDINLNFEPPMFFYHLSGGLTLFQGSNDLCWLGESHSNKLILFSTLSGSPQDALKAYRGIRALARTRFEHAEDLKDPVSDNFALCETGKRTTECLAFRQMNFWDRASTGFLQQKKHDEYFMACRMATQIKKSVRRLEKLSVSYRTATSYYKPPKKRTRHLELNKYSAHVGGEFASMLDDLYATRDALNALVYRLVYKKSDGFTTKKFKPHVIDDVTPIGRAIFNAMFGPDARKAIIARMSTYRAVSLHCLGSSNPVFGDCLTSVTRNGPLGPLTKLVFPLYDDIARLKQIELGYSSGNIVPIPHDEAKRFMRARHEDALDFAYDCFIQILRISELMSFRGDIPQKTTTITEKDIVSATITNADGTVTRLKRDPKTGTLKRLVS